MKRKGAQDAFAVALATLNDMPVVSGDPEFARVEGRVKVMWLQNR